MDALIFLGTGGGWPTAGRTCSSLLLETGARRYLLDAGEPCSHRLKMAGVPLASIDAVFISHGHSDHLSGLPMLIQGAWLESRDRPLPIYLPRELIAPLKTWLETVYLPANILGFPVEYHAWEAVRGPKVTLDSGRLGVSVSPTTHLDGLRTLIDPSAHDRFRSYSLTLAWPSTGRRLVYSADLGEPSDLDAPLAIPCDLLVCEMAHFTPETLFAYLRHKPVRQLCLTHLSRGVRSARVEAILRSWRRKMLGADVSRRSPPRSDGNARVGVLRAGR